MIEKLKTKLTDDKFFSFVSTMMKQDQNYRELVTKYHTFTEESMKPDYELIKKITPAYPENAKLSYDY